MSSSLKVAPFISDVELPFYQSLANNKINHDKLDDSIKRVLGVYEIRPSDPVSRSCRMQILGNALTSNETVGHSSRAEGVIKNFNTVADFKNFDRAALLQKTGKQIWDAILDSTILSCPSLLVSFIIIAFADLKKYHFTQWFAFPALHSDPPWQPVPVDGSPIRKLDPEQSTSLVGAVNTWRFATKDERQHGFFLAKRVAPLVLNEDRPLSPVDETSRRLSIASLSSQQSDSAPGSRWEIGTLSDFLAGFFDGVPEEDRYIAFYDPSNFPENPGWMLRNLLVLIRHQFHLSRVQILCYRDTHATRETPHSLIVTLETSTSTTSTTLPPISALQVPKITGWERNATGALGPKSTDLSSYLDPTKLADQAADLNLKLIKWRLAPDINLDIIKSTSYLLLGAGTLGSNVARLLLGWGARKITFVDNATVSLSNPVRQSLFTFSDAKGGGVPKAACAAKALQLVAPSVEATGVALSVPMPGHPITDEPRTRRDFETLESLIESHDVIFLLMDTRESRYLPSLLGRAKGKLVLNAALGFDSWLAMRHGMEEPHVADGLGCYFCNDVVAPVDSTRDATLDQQCTVTRPGVAYFAAAALVEICVATLQSPLQGRTAPPSLRVRDAAAAFSPSKSTVPAAAEPENPLGAVPHQMRGFLSTFTTVCIHGPAYDACSVCSPKIVEAYRREGWGFVRRAMDERGFVEELSGLAEVQRAAEAADVDFEGSDLGGDDGFEGDGEVIG